MEVVSTDSNGIVGIYPQQPELGAAWQIHFKMACAFMSRWLVFTDPVLILAMVLELEVFGLGVGRRWCRDEGCEVDQYERLGQWVRKELTASMWWAHLCTRPVERRRGAVGENDFLRHYHQSPDRSGPPIPPWGWKREEGDGDAGLD